MSTYSVTGATGSTGRRPVERLLRRPTREQVFAPVGPQSAAEPPHHATGRAPDEPPGTGSASARVLPVPLPATSPAHRSGRVRTEPAAAAPPRAAR
ncbi:hypothetical protein [Saccharothrix syringae]|uniref:Uncharacterized protein n=1 Tax=Saccharothrix syringae TaxID=103733 RepID=A0A5Q0GUT0_SACSY|nr:hypothetical protein [Saccharothrix syringae]QFZ17122.1 hypothetical protein EKG83_06275 [Saccharothrix syringae]